MCVYVCAHSRFSFADMGVMCKQQMQLKDATGMNVERTYFSI